MSQAKTLNTKQKATKSLRDQLRKEIERYKQQAYPVLPPDISLRVELADIDYDKSKYENLGVYSNRQIKQALLDGHIRIYPYIEKNLNTTSYDITLGDWFYLTDRTRNRVDFNFHDKSDVERYFGQPLQAVSNREWCHKQNRCAFSGVKADALVIVLNPHERILAHTWEFIGIDGPGTCQMQARSTYGRNGIVVCKDAGWGDSGYKGRWTMEIQNDNNERVPLLVGSRVGQFVFYGSGIVRGNYGTTGKYYRTSSLAGDIKKWQPEMMLPGAYKDRYVPPIPLEGRVNSLKSRLL